LTAPIPYILCCDWGTSSFRLRLVHRLTGNISAEILSSQGVSIVYEQWREMNPLPSRETYYLEFIRNQIKGLEGKFGKPLDAVPFILTGMASSSIGLRELPYAQTPFPLDGSAAISTQLVDNKRPILLVSGLRTNHEVMRGEEIQLMGLESLIRELEKPGTPTVVILPGTHSKHVVVEQGTITDFSTAMTGELFQLLSSRGLLSLSLGKPEKDDPPDWNAFGEGVRLARNQALLHALFKVRTNDLLGNFNPLQNFHFLSGLLIGAELSELRSYPDSPIVLCSSAHLLGNYQYALRELGMIDRTHQVSPEEFDHLTILSQIKIAERNGL